MSIEGKGYISWSCTANIFEPISIQRVSSYLPLVHNYPRLPASRVRETLPGQGCQLLSTPITVGASQLNNHAKLVRLALCPASRPEHKTQPQPELQAPAPIRCAAALHAASPSDQPSRMEMRIMTSSSIPAKHPSLPS